MRHLLVKKILLFSLVPVQLLLIIRAKNCWYSKVKIESDCCVNIVVVLVVVVVVVVVVV